ncbi:circadian clock protein KaiB (plasmid) [Hymenobacter tibetensis]|uniref:Circadian clock protein KaiB n=1 Tax=Hymenobacter tibetensis TaxID=497967 RepID=A0ABY4D8X2_9BACT|nr:circadian clock KaiB family protein [Hymenobacter tibetensis]UOG77666.1 circadian clock protein KaiB [Hymenobacter tibetensis]
MLPSPPQPPLFSVDAAGSEQPELPEYELQLYVAGTAGRSATARRHLEAICHQYLRGRYTLTIVDLHHHPERAEEDAILGLPCLVKKRPGLVRRLVGDFSDVERVLKVLGVQ